LSEFLLVKFSSLPYIQFIAGERLKALCAACLKNSAKTLVNATRVPKNVGGSRQPPVFRLKKRIFSTWSVAGYLWRTAMSLQNGYRISR
jgi:hypothetical protein